MITREELEKMIENGETFYWELKCELVNGYSYSAIPSTSFREFELCDNHLEATDKLGKHWWLEFEDIYDNEEDASWRAKNWGKRIERFEPPHWSEIDETKFWKYVFAVPKSCCRGQIIMNRVYVFVDWGYKGCCDGQKLFGEPTQENYEKAVDFARKLFLGEVEK